jgi:histone-lysine N-methyltransferase SETMAR
MIVLPNRLIANGHNCLSMVEKSLDADLCQAAVFCDWQGILMIDSLYKGSTVTGEYYANLMHRFRDSIKVKRCEKLTQGVLLLRDNASVHKARLSKAAIAESDFVEIDHPPYSPDLVPCDYFSFSNLKKTLRETKLRDDDELRAAVEWHFRTNQMNIFIMD